VANCKVHLRASAALELEALPAIERTRIIEWLGTLGSNPRPPESEAIAEGGRYRATVEARAVLYTFDEERATIVIGLIR